MINHVEIYILDWKNEELFWKKINKIFDFRIIDKWKNGFSVGMDFSSYISFNEIKNANENYKRVNLGINHLAVKTKLEKESVLNILLKEGIKTLYKEKNEHNIFIENNWGLKIEIVF
ncbi:hypothetical protein CG006_00600 [Mesoplasma florum]|uniref:hypothetical protein n=1 Tax=Mesoplasma florum TaxID=2151 RepID=UPI000D027227|nr:hypothetical protein [Mesoplasma florum]AVN63492.1 hypothetical protein CG006_00600 [Mesoplasma florum]